MSDPLRHFDNLICIAEFVPMSDERKEMVRQAASEVARLRLTDAEREDLECAASRLQSDPNGPRDLQVADTLRGLLERLGGEG